MTHQVERVTSGVVVLDILLDCGLSTNAVPVHTRFGDWTRPPLDFRFDSITGVLYRVNMALQDEYPELDASIEVPTPSSEGGVCLETSDPLPGSLTVDGRYQDQRVNVRIAKTHEGYLAVVIGAPSTVDATDMAIAFDAHHMLLVSPVHRLRGLLVRLDDSEWQVISHPSASAP